MKIEFSGGLDTVFGGNKEFNYEITEPITVNEVITFLISKANEYNGDTCMFLQDGLIRPGVLVLINDVDWELLDKEDSELDNKDVVLLSSTLHGG